MSELPPGHIEIHKKDHSHHLWLTPAVASVLRICAHQGKISAIDAGNRILLGFLSEHYGYVSPSEFYRRALKAIYPTRKVINETIVSILMGNSLQKLT